MNKFTFSCCGNRPKYIITYNVADEEKTYQVCESCSKLECFCKYVLKKSPMYSRVKRSLDLD